MPRLEKKLHIFVCLLLAVGKEAFTQMTPSNAVAEIGGGAIFNCSGTTFLPHWFMSKDGTSTNQLPIAGSCNVDVNLQNHYRTEQTGGPPTCNLIVFSVTMEQAGVYWCVESSAPAYALLTVIESSPVIVDNSSRPTAVMENESVMIECSLSYNGSVSPVFTLRPYFYWTNSSGQNVSSYTDSTSETRVVSQFIVTAVRQDIMPSTCHVYMNLTLPATGGYANDTPTVNMSASSQTVEVLYGPSIPVITIAHQILEIHGIACEVGVLTSSSSGNPQPSYEWFDTKENASISNERTFDLAESNRNYTCAAKNTIRDVVYHELSFHVNRNQTGVQDCRFPRNESTWINVTGCDDNGTCSCSKGYDGLNLTCNTDSYPDASFKWIGDDGIVINSKVYSNITTDGLYYCTAYMNRSTSNYTGKVLFTDGSSEKNVTECCAVENLVLSAVIPFLMKNLIVFVICVVCLKLNKDFGVTMTRRFHWLRKLQHCSKDEAVEILLCICFVIGSLVSGLFVIPVLITIAFCSGNHGQDELDHEMHARRNQTGADDKSKGRVEHGEDDARTKGSTWMLPLMWCIVAVALVPIAFIIVFFAFCNQMRYEVV